MAWPFPLSPFIFAASLMQCIKQIIYLSNHLNIHSPIYLSILDPDLLIHLYILLIYLEMAETMVYIARGRDAGAIYSKLLLR